MLLGLSVEFMFMHLLFNKMSCRVIACKSLIKRNILKTCHYLLTVFPLIKMSY